MEGVMFGPPAGGWGGAALTGFAAAARVEADRIAALANPETPVAGPKTPCSLCEFKDKTIALREEVIAKLNDTVDDQAAQIVALQAKVDTVTPAERVTEMMTLRETVRNLQSIDVAARRSIERAEARCAQLEGWAREQNLETPNEAAYYSTQEWGTARPF